MLTKANVPKTATKDIVVYKVLYKNNLSYTEDNHKFKRGLNVPDGPQDGEHVWMDGFFGWGSTRHPNSVNFPKYPFKPSSTGWFFAYRKPDTPLVVSKRRETWYDEERKKWRSRRIPVKVVKMIIPAGAKYLVSCNKKEICSDRMIYEMEEVKG